MDVAVRTRLEAGLYSGEFALRSGSRQPNYSMEFVFRTRTPIVYMGNVYQSGGVAANKLSGLALLKGKSSG